jgi:hypothetical protein
MAPLRTLILIVLTALLPATCFGNLIWIQAGGISGSSGSGAAHINSFITGGANGNANLVPTGTTLSYGAITDGNVKLDYAVTFSGGSNPLRAEPVNNSFTIHADGQADFFSASFGNFGSRTAGTFADNGSAGLTITFYELGTYDSRTGTGISTNANVSLAAVNTQPSIYSGGSDILRLSSSEFYDLNGVGTGTIETDPLNQILTDSTPGLNRLTNYEPARLPIGSTGPTDPGTGGFTDPLTGDLRLEFDATHDVVDAEWSLQLTQTPRFNILRAGDDGQRSGIGFTGTLTSVPEPGSFMLASLLGLPASLRRRRRTRKHS